jgi:hypothetical protein
MTSTQMKTVAVYLLLLLSCFPQILPAQELPRESRQEIERLLNAIARKEIALKDTIKINSIKVLKKNELVLFANIHCSNIPFREDNVEMIYNEVRALLPHKYAKHKLQIRTNNRAIEDLIPLTFRHTKSHKKEKTFANKTDVPLVTRLSVPYTPQSGLQNRHIALWQSHGYHYEAKQTRWAWQRARVFQTVEDLYTQSYVLPYLVPMLENAGANVLLPRERDTQLHEVIIDNDTCQPSPKYSPETEKGTLHQSLYAESTGAKSWRTGNTPGFAHLRQQYIDFENPFKEGTYRFTETVKEGEESLAEWIPDIPQAGRYAVYVSYQTVSHSTNDALYTVHHKGGVSHFHVNQQMGGGTWIYLGHFAFGEGRNDHAKIVLSNKSAKAGRIVSADAVKVGGGYGNIARRVATYPYEPSGYPRFTEAARYWLQWAGMPDSIYSNSHGKNDYTDDYKSRGSWVNYLAGGSVANPRKAGLQIPLDMAFAFHSDAGTTLNDSIIGTLGIFQTASYGGVFANGASRYLSRDLTDMIQTQIVNDIRALHEPQWSRRGMWNQGYAEARVPKVPTMLLELLSHQNFADMRYGLDPRFRFTASRAIYKGILRFIAYQYDSEYVVQPLPVNEMSLCFTNENEIELTWQPTEDPLESTAKPDAYVVYTRIGEGDFDNGTVVGSCVFRSVQSPGTIYSYKVTALNGGGESFPSETLSAARAADEQGVVLIVNGFDRISAPADFVTDSIAGFYDVLDHGVPYKEDISYIGSMKEFHRSIPWTDNDASGFGDSYSHYATMVIAGNTFDYPAVHGAAILKAGYSFVSCSDEAIENQSQSVNMNDYKWVDLILGKERQTKTGRGGVVPLEFKTFTREMQEAITDYCYSGGNIFVSGAFIASDLWDTPLSSKEDKDFAAGVLKYKWRTGQAAVTGRVKSVVSPYASFTGKYRYYNEPNPESYVVESPDAIEPAVQDAYTIFRYSENNLSAGIAYKGKYKTCVLGFPFESLRTAEEREGLMRNILNFFNDKFD